jgi:hypothetical protein
VERRRLLLGAVLGLAACRPRVPRYPLPRVLTLYVVVSPQVAKNDTGNVSGMVDAIEEDLRDDGYEVSIVAARDDEAPPASRVELRVVTSDPADQEAMAAGQLGNLAGVPLGVGVIGIGGGGILVDAYFVPGGNQPPAYVGRFEAGTLMAMAEDAQTVAGERAGHGIARKLLEHRYAP